jgi:hypothetical protein
MSQPTPIVIHAQHLRRALITLVVTLSTLGLLAEIGYELNNGEDPWDLVEFTSLSWEENLPTWAASGLLLGCSLLLWLCGRVDTLQGGQWRRYWYLLALLFAYISMDEIAQIHEHWSHFVDAGGGLLYFSWVIPAAIIVLVLALILRRFLLQLPQMTRRRFVVAAVLYVGGALLMELPLGYWADHHDTENLVYGLIDWVEETLELAGTCVFLYALLLHLLQPPAGLAIRLAASGATPRAPGTD